MAIRKLLQLKGLQKKCRAKRGKLFLDLLEPTEEKRILDLGGGNGNYISKLIPFKKNVYIADINRGKLKKSREKGYQTIFLDQGTGIPFDDSYFDIIFCSSVIEHTTVNKKDIENFKTNKEFRKKAMVQQKKFALEIQRTGKSYFVQTPYKYFPLESHSRLPMLLVLLPRKLQIKIIKFFRTFWFARTIPDWNLLTVQDMKNLFPDATIIREKWFFFTKSIMAVKTNENNKEENIQMKEES